MEDVYFEEDGVVSLWVGQVKVAPGSNFLRDLYRVDDYDPDNQECIVQASATPIVDLIAELSYSESFRDAALAAAEQLRMSSPLWIMAQYDFAYDPAAVQLIDWPAEPKFLGTFAWNDAD